MSELINPQVEDLIDALKKLPQNLPVSVHSMGNGIDIRHAGGHVAIVGFHDDHKDDAYGKEVMPNERSEC